MRQKDDSEIGVRKEKGQMKTSSTPPSNSPLPSNSFQRYNLLKRGNSNRRNKCIPTETRRRMLVGRNNEDSIVSAPPAAEYIEPPFSVQSEPKVISTGMNITVRHTRKHHYLDTSSHTEPTADLSQCRSNQGSRMYSSLNRIENKGGKMNQTTVSNGTYKTRQADSIKSSVQLPKEDATIAEAKTIVTEETSKSLNSQQLLRRRKPDSIKSAVKVPKGKVTIVITDIQGSTSLWEADASAMQVAQNLHDTTIRKCYSTHNGYEVTTEGDSFQLAFQHPMDAFSFCLQAQVDLYNANWSNAILKLDNAKLDKENVLNGLRVRMSLQHGPTETSVHPVTQRIFYSGETVLLAKSLVNMCHGGQILTTVETWRNVSGMAERYMGSPQVIDCGDHVLRQESLTHKRLLQLVPKRFSFEYFNYRGTEGKKKYKRLEGRRFPPLKSKKKLSTDFFEAPYANDFVTLLFMKTVVQDDLSTSAKAKNSAVLAAKVRYYLIHLKSPGYECQEEDGGWMLAFHSMASAVIFGLKVVNFLGRSGAPLNVKVGIHAGNFASMGPHAITGRADYFGTIVNRAARISAAAKQGQVLVGLAIENGKEENHGLADLNNVEVNFLRKEKFKGVSTEIAVYSCNIDNDATSR